MGEDFSQHHHRHHLLHLLSLVNLVLALAFSLYLLAQKETLTGQAKKVVRALFSEKWAHWITDVARMTNRTFSILSPASSQRRLFWAPCASWVC